MLFNKCLGRVLSEFECRILIGLYTVTTKTVSAEAELYGSLVVANNLINITNLNDVS